MSGDLQAHLSATSQHRCHGNCDASQSEPSAVSLWSGDQQQQQQPSQYYEDSWGFCLTTPESSPGSEECSVNPALATTAARSPAACSYNAIDEG